MRLLHALLVAAVALPAVAAEPPAVLREAAIASPKALTDYKATKTPAGRDLLKPWVEAFRAEGLKIGFYHSLIDWRHPEFPVDGYHPQRDDLAFREAASSRDMRRYVDYLHGQVRELLTSFGKIDILWLDFSYSQQDWGWSRGKGSEDWQSERLIEMARRLQPGIIINNRSEVEQDFHTPEQFQPRGWLQVGGRPVLWEACHTLNGSWGYDRDNGAGAAQKAIAPLQAKS